MLFRTVLQVSIIPLEFLCVTAMGILVINPIYLGTKFVPLKNVKTSETVLVNLGQIYRTPKLLIFDSKVQAECNRVNKLFDLTVAFALMYVFPSPMSMLLKFINIRRYPILGGIFFNSGVLVQSILVPIFFALRSCFEYSADVIAAKTFGPFSFLNFDLHFRFLIATPLLHTRFRRNASCKFRRCYNA